MRHVPLNRINRIWFIGLAILLYIHSLCAQSNLIKTSFSVNADPGIALQTDLYCIDTASKYPVILLRTPYPRQQYTSIAQHFCSQGFAFVVQSVRGTGGSGGRMMPFINETRDGIVTLDAISQKSWCNGAIGMFGSSYSAFCGLTLGASKHSALKAIVNINGWLEPALIAMPSGVNHLMLNIPWMLFIYSQGKLVPGKYNADSLFRFTPVNEVLQNFTIPISLEQMSAGIANFNKNFPYKDFNVPVMHVTGMYDFTKEGTFNLYDSLRNYNKTQRILIGPWVHDQIFNPSTKVGDWELSKSGYDSIMVRILRGASSWFKVHIKNEILKNPPRVFSALPVFGQLFNLNADEYPTKEIRQVNFYLSTNNQGQYILKKEVDNHHSLPVSFLSDPNNPVPTTGGANFHFFHQNIGIKKQNEVEKRKDVITYTSDNIYGQFWGLGKARIKLFVSHEAQDCDFTAKLVAVDKDENAWIITDGITRMSRTNKRDIGIKDTDGNPIYEIEVDMGHIVFLLQPLWRIRIEIAGSNFPKYDRNPGNGVDPLTATKFSSVKQTIHSGKQFPSVLIIDEID